MSKVKNVPAKTTTTTVTVLSSVDVILNLSTTIDEMGVKQSERAIELVQCLFALKWADRVEVMKDVKTNLASTAYSRQLFSQVNYLVSISGMINRQSNREKFDNTITSALGSGTATLQAIYDLTYQITSRRYHPQLVKNKVISRKKSTPLLQPTEESLTYGENKINSSMIPLALSIGENAACIVDKLDTTRKQEIESKGSQYLDSVKLSITEETKAEKAALKHVTAELLEQKKKLELTKAGTLAAQTDDKEIQAKVKAQGEKLAEAIALADALEHERDELTQNNKGMAQEIENITDKAKEQLEVQVAKEIAKSKTTNERALERDNAIKLAKVAALEKKLEAKEALIEKNKEIADELTALKKSDIGSLSKVLEVIYNEAEKIVKAKGIAEKNDLARSIMILIKPK